jgi:hypothetical protein
MPTFEIEQYELHVLTYRIQAASTAKAIVKLFDGLGELVGDSLELVELCEDRGLPVEEHRELAEALRSAGIPVDGDVIPSIRNVRRVE